MNDNLNNFIRFWCRSEIFFSDHFPVPLPSRISGFVAMASVVNHLLQLSLSSQWISWESLRREHDSNEKNVASSKYLFLLLGEGGAMGPRALRPHSQHLLLREAQGKAYKLWYETSCSRDHTHQRLRDMARQLMFTVESSGGSIVARTKSVKYLLEWANSPDSMPWHVYDAEEKDNLAELFTHMPEWVDLLERPLRKKWASGRSAGGGGDDYEGGDEGGGGGGGGNGSVGGGESGLHHETQVLNGRGSDNGLAYRVSRRRSEPARLAPIAVVNRAENIVFDFSGGGGGVEPRVKVERVTPPRGAALRGGSARPPLGGSAPPPSG